MKNFEEFLKDKFAENYRGLDDNMPDSFDNWLSNLDGEEYMRFGDEYGQFIKMYIESNIKIIFDEQEGIVGKVISEIEGSTPK